jgi:2-dehydro-3-deoxyphosphogluconate aldolase/(4S)-4-hydroxy-2-oxoglutarate aldolase
MSDCIPEKSIVPVLVVDDLSNAEPLANALIEGGVQSIEVTLRTTAALSVIEKIKKNFPALKVGAGTANTAQLYSSAVDAGADFVMTPGFTECLIEQSIVHDVPFIPGVSTLSEMMRLKDRGFRVLKLFPAEVVGGLGLLKAVNAVLPELSFCPTGGVNEQNVKDYLSLNNVTAIGGSWIATRDDIHNHRWDVIKKKASGLR